MKRLGRVLLPLLLALALFALYWFVQENPGVVDRLRLQRKPVLSALLFVACLPVIFFIVRALDLVAFDVFASRRARVRAPALLRELVAIAVFLILLAWAISTIFEYKVTAFLATGTIVAAVLGLALQETLGNLFAGIALHLEDSFEIGDVIRSGEYFGTVEGVRWRGTRIRTFNNDVVIIPNSVLAREHLEVFPRGNLNARLVQVGIDYNIPPATVIGILAQAASNIEGVSREIPALARVAGFGDSAINYDIKYFTRDYSQRDRIDADIRKAVWYALRRNGVPIPFPIRSLQRYEPPAQKHHPRAEEILQRLSGIDILSPLSPAAHEAIAAAARVYAYSKGETIIRHGAAGDSMFIVHAGEVSVRIADDGPPHEVARLAAGDVFGEMALLTGETRTADVIALTDVTAVEITKDALQPVLHDHPELAAAVSAKVMERQGTLDTLRAGAREDEQRTILSRIRAYFGL